MVRFSLFSFLLFVFAFLYSPVFAQDTELKADVDLAKKYFHEGQMLKADSMLEIASSKLTDDTEAESVFTYRYYSAQSQMSKWNLKQADSLFIDATDLAVSLKDTHKIVAALSGLATVKNLQGEVLESIGLLEEAKDMSLQKDSVKYYGLVANLGIAYDDLEQYDKALSNYLIALAYYEKEGEVTNQALIENNLGELYRERFNDHEQAEKRYREAIRLNKSINNESNLSLNYHNLSLNFLNVAEPDSALKYIFRAIDLKKAAGEEGRLATDYFVLGDIYLEMKEYDLAREKYEKTLGLSKKYSIPPGIYYANIGLAEVFKQNGNPQRASRYAMRALGAAKEMNSPAMNAEVYKWLYEFYKDQENYTDAIFFLERYDALSDSLNAERDEVVLNAARAQYETDIAKAENQKLLEQKRANEANAEYRRLLNIGLVMLLVFLVVISLIIFNAYRMKTKALKELSKLNSELQDSHAQVIEQKNELRKLNKLKTNIVSVLGHDLRGPLTNVSGLMQLLSEKLISEDEFGEMAKMLNEKTITGLKSLDMVLEWSRLKAGDSDPKVQLIDPKEKLQEIIDLNKNALADKELKINLKLQENIFVPADLNQFQSIANNLISNAIKFSDNGGEIKAEVTEQNGYVLFFVEDAGKGFSEDILALLDSGERLAPSQGSRGERGTGIGLRIVRDFVEAHKGKFEIRNNEVGHGVVTVYFPQMDEIAQAV